MAMNITSILNNLTLEEKAGLCSGKNFWWTKAVDRLGIPSIMVSDGPHGLRKQAEEADHLGINDSIKAICFPSGAGLGASFDRNLATDLGNHLGEEARAEKLHTVLGPAINMKRSPLCGRNFEYLSEDPYLAGELSASYVNAVQSHGVGVCVKHFAANNQEYRRMSTDTIVDEQTLREIYLTAFEKTVKQAKPWSLMCAYNRLNGTYCCENDWLLDDVLRKEWGFDGIVITDWGAMNNRVESLKASLELEMPSSNGINDAKIVTAVQNGLLSEEVLDQVVLRLLTWIDQGAKDEIAAYDKEAHHAFARKAASQCAVLLKNENDLLPLSKDDDILFIGQFAKKPRFQGGGSSHINAYKISSALEATTNMNNISYVDGWEEDSETGNPSKFEEAIQAAKKSKVTIIFAGLPDSYESEGYDRSHMDLPSCQNELIKAVANVQPNTIVVLHNGSPITMPWVNDVNSILEMYLGGQAVGEATIDILFGDSEPSGRLAESFPNRIEDTPCYLSFPGDGKKVVYQEGLFIGYRWYDSRNMNVLFPFGHGLGYTRFELSDFTLSADTITAGSTVYANVKIKNIGSRSGTEVIQLYVSSQTIPGRPKKELKGFTKVSLEIGEEKMVSIELDPRSFSVYDTTINDWHIPTGNYTILLGTSSRNLPLETSITITNTPTPLKLEDWTTIADLFESGYGDIVEPILKNMSAVLGGEESEAINNNMMKSMLEGMTLHALKSFSPEALSLIESIEHKLK